MFVKENPDRKKKKKKKQICCNNTKLERVTEWKLFGLTIDENRILNNVIRT